MKGLIEYINESSINESISLDDHEDLFNAYMDVLDSNYKAEGKSFVENVVMPLADGVDIEDFLENFLYDYDGLEWLEHKYKNAKDRDDIDALIIRHAKEWLSDEGFE